jgi:hypothetical protein
MTSLHVSDFSCLKEASFELAPVNVIIGPQGSGKSVTTKLFYFFSDILSNFVNCAEKGETIEEYKKVLSRQFSIWFPPSAWGGNRFNINYASGDFSVRLLRRYGQGKVKDDVSVTFSEWFSDFYNRTCELFRTSRLSDELEFDAGVQFREVLDRNLRIRELTSKRLANELGKEYLAQQTFIPAGRAFFTSIGRLVAGIEQATSLDPVTIKFARLFANLKDRNFHRTTYRFSRLGKEFVDKRSQFMGKLFGGEIKFENETEFVEAFDGRKIPFSSLSSGQQELLPMWSLIDYFNELDAIRQTSGNRNATRFRELIYIEEPEAHLFPSAQSLLMEFLIESFVSERNLRSLVLTTHSPYIMSKLNVFLKAGQLARRKRKNLEINEIVPRECWLNEKQLSAFAIEDGYMMNLLDSDGMIDATYLDQVSEDISNEYSRLLKIESEI